ncbi:hypothetical protein FQZ97_1075310 [compost metagenome]
MVSRSVEDSSAAPVAGRTVVWTVWLKIAVVPTSWTLRSLLVHDTTRQPSASQDAHSVS